MFPISKDHLLCRFLFQSTFYFMFSIYVFCFQSHNDVSNISLCFQSTLFPMYVSNLHITFGGPLPKIGDIQSLIGCITNLWFLDTIKVRSEENSSMFGTKFQFQLFCNERNIYKDQKTLTMIPTIQTQDEVDSWKASFLRAGVYPEV